MTDDQIELRLRRALLEEGAEFARSIDHGAIRARLSNATARERRSRRGLWLTAAAAIIAFTALGVIVVVAPKDRSTPGQPSPTASSSGPVSTIGSMEVDPGWRLALGYAGQVTTAVPNPVGIHFTLPADATRWALKVRCSGPSALVVSTTTFVHTAPCADAGDVSRAVYGVETTQASGEIHLGIRGIPPTSFELIAETTASELGDPLTLDPTPGPTDVGPIGPGAPPLVIPSDWIRSTDPVNGGSGGITSMENDTPILHAGPVRLVLTCVGSGSLNIELIKISDPAALQSIAPGAGQIIRCDGAAGQVTLQLTKPADGTENGIEVEPEAADPNVDFAWSLELGQDRP